MKKIPKHFRRFLVLMFGLLAVDLATKYIFFDKQIASNIGFIQPMFNLGISRSIQVPGFVSICVGRISLLLFIIIYHRKYISWRMAAMLIAGTLGNMIDRIGLGGVRDFLMPFDWFPIFNIADILLNMGIIIYIRKEFFTGKSKLKK